MAEEAPRIPKLVLSIWGAVTLGCLSGSAGLARCSIQAEEQGHDIAANWRQVQGTVVDTRSARNPDDGWDSYWATLVYTDASGDEHRYQAKAAYTAYDEESYPLYYDPRHPENAEWPPSHRRSDLWIPTAVLGLFGLVFLGIGTQVYWAARCAR